MTKRHDKKLANQLYSESPLNRLLNRLENVHKRGEGYRADCPNGHRSKQQLSVGLADNGSLLIHCFAGCSIHEILTPIGLKPSDLYEQTRETEKTPVPSWQQRELMKMRRWRNCRDDLLKEASVLLSIAGQAAYGCEVTQDDKIRAERAARIFRETLRGL